MPEAEAPVCLSGTAVSGDYSGALIGQPDKPGLRPVKTGDTVDDWTVGEIGPRYIVLNRGDQAVRLDMSKDTPQIETEAAAEPASPLAVKKGPVRHTRSLARGGS